jgi:uncharacterized protein (TIGR02679 family)
MRLRLSELDAALLHAGVSSTLREALETLDGPIHDLRAARIAREKAWTALLTSVEHPRLKALVDDPVGGALLKRFSGGDPQEAARLLENVGRVADRLPARGLPLAQLAADELGDAHALDVGRPVATLVLRALSLEQSTVRAGCESSGSESDSRQEVRAVPQSDSPPRRGDAEHSAGHGEAMHFAGRGEPDGERAREQWARLGITVNELAAPALCLNLSATGDTVAACVARAAAARGEPLHLTLRMLLRDPPAWDVAGRRVYVCENPSILSIAADRLGARCEPLVCTNGMPAAAQQTLLRQLVASGASLAYHGDFDWPGIRIANFVMRELGASPWRFSARDYLAACVGFAGALPDEGRIEALWDGTLSAEMRRQGKAVHEEAVVDSLVGDLGRR